MGEALDFGFPPYWVLPATPPPLVPTCHLVFQSHLLLCVARSFETVLGRHRLISSLTTCLCGRRCRIHAGSRFVHCQCSAVLENAKDPRVLGRAQQANGRGGFSAERAPCRGEGPKPGPAEANLLGKGDTCPSSTASASLGLRLSGAPPPEAARDLQMGGRSRGWRKTGPCKPDSNMHGGDSQKEKKQGQCSGAVLPPETRIVGLLGLLGNDADVCLSVGRDEKELIKNTENRGT